MFWLYLLALIVAYFSKPMDADEGTTRFAFQEVKWTTKLIIGIAVIFISYFIMTLISCCFADHEDFFENALTIWFVTLMIGYYIVFSAIIVGIKIKYADDLERKELPNGK